MCAPHSFKLQREWVSMSQNMVDIAEHFSLEWPLPDTAPASKGQHRATVELRSVLDLVVHHFLGCGLADGLRADRHAFHWDRRLRVWGRQRVNSPAGIEDDPVANAEKKRPLPWPVLVREIDGPQLKHGKSVRALDLADQLDVVDELPDGDR